MCSTQTSTCSRGPRRSSLRRTTTLKLELPPHSSSSTLPPASHGPRAITALADGPATWSRRPLRSAPRDGRRAPLRRPDQRPRRGRAVREDRGRVRLDRAATARLRVAGACRGRRRGTLTRRLNGLRPRCRSSPHSRPTRRSTAAATPGSRRSARRSPSSCPARGCRRRSRRRRRSPTSSPWAPPPARCPSRGAGGRSSPHPARTLGCACGRAGDRRRCRRGDGADPLARRLARRAPRRGRGARTAEMAARGEPLVGGAPGTDTEWPTSSRRPRARARAPVRARLRVRAVADNLRCAAEPPRRGAGRARRSRAPAESTDAAARAPRPSRSLTSTRPAPTTGRARGKARRAMNALPFPVAAPPSASRGPARGPAPPPPIRSPTASTRRATSSSSSPSSSATAALSRPPRRRRAWEWARRCSRCARRSRTAQGRPRAPSGRSTRCRPPELDVALRAFGDGDDWPSLSRHIEREATLDQVLEFLVHRSTSRSRRPVPPRGRSSV